MLEYIKVIFTGLYDFLCILLKRTGALFSMDGSVYKTELKLDRLTAAQQKDKADVMALDTEAKELRDNDLKEITEQVHEAEAGYAKAIRELKVWRSTAPKGEDNPVLVAAAAEALSYLDASKAHKKTVEAQIATTENAYLEGLRQLQMSEIELCTARTRLKTLKLQLKRNAVKNGVLSKQNIRDVLKDIQHHMNLLESAEKVEAALKEPTPVDEPAIKQDDLIQRVNQDVENLK